MKAFFALHRSVELGGRRAHVAEFRSETGSKVVKSGRSAGLDPFLDQELSASFIGGKDGKKED